MTTKEKLSLKEKTASRTTLNTSHIRDITTFRRLNKTT